METKGNINWEISVLEAKTGDGRSLRKALAKEANRKRKEEKKANEANKLPAGTIVPPKAEANADADVDADSGEVDPNMAKLKRLRIDKARGALHQRRRVFHSIMKKLLTLEKVRRQRLIKKAKITLDKPETEEKERGIAERAVEENTEILAQVMPIKADDLVECMVFKFFKRSPMIRENLGEYQPQPHITKMVEEKVVMRILNDIKAVNVIKAAVLAVERQINGGALAPRKQANNEARALMKQERSAKKQKVLEIKLEKKKRRAEKYGAPGSDGKDNDANTKSTFVAMLGEYNSDDNAESASAKKRKTDSDDYAGDDDPAFKEIYGIDEKRNRPGQRARRQ
ncbi:hypothetical protein EV175_003195, partial [Coemansia sp. RSA 1933]